MEDLELFNLVRENYHKVNEDYIQEQIKAATDYLGKWVPVSERLPEEPFGCLVTVVGYNPVTGDSFSKILPCYVGYDGERWNDCDGEEIFCEVLAWMPLPEPYKGV